jgi:germination protein M
MRRWVIPLGVFLILLAGLIGFATRTGEIVKLRRQNEQLTAEKFKLRQGFVKRSAKEQVALFFAENTKDNLYLKPVVVELEIPNQAAKPKMVLEALLKGPPAGTGYLPFFPKDTQVLGVKVKDGLAEVNLNRRATQLNVGSQGEALAVASIVNTLTKLPMIFKVKILIEGKEVESLAGHVDLSETFQYNSDLVSY